MQHFVRYPAKVQVSARINSGDALNRTIQRGRRAFASEREKQSNGYHGIFLGIQ